MDFEDAVALHQAGDLAGAEASYRRIIDRQDHARALSNLAVILKERGDFTEAESLLLKSISIDPTNPHITYNLGNLYWRSGQFVLAARQLEHAIALGAGDSARLNLGNVYLSLGRDAEGWALYETRTERASTRAKSLSFPEWRGEDLSGKTLFLWPEQGFGDQILAARFLPTNAKLVTLACRPELAPLFRRLGVNIVPVEDRMVIPPHDYWSLPLSLPRWQRAKEAPYLEAETTAATPGFGVAWRGNARPDPGRSLPPSLADELLSLPGARSLDPADTGAVDFLQTANLIAALDFVVSIDTSVAHLAAAMGKRCLLLLQKNSVDWRWRSEKPWYSSVEIFRQPSQGDWNGAIRTVEDRIRALEFGRSV